VTEKYSVKEEGESSNPSSVPPQIKQELEPESHQLLPPAAAAQEEAGTAAPKQPREFYSVLRIRCLFDPGPGSGIRNRFFSGSRIPTPIFFRDW
jgi:hypothetical protein